jgi:hypothetical protein
MCLFKYYFHHRFTSKHTARCHSTPALIGSCSQAPSEGCSYHEAAEHTLRVEFSARTWSACRATVARARDVLGDPSWGIELLSGSIWLLHQQQARGPQPELLQQQLRDESGSKGCGRVAHGSCKGPDSSFRQVEQVIGRSFGFC